MTHLHYNQFTELMENGCETSVVTKNCIYKFKGISKHAVLIQISVILKEDYQIGEKGFFVTFDKVVTMTEAQCTYMSLE